MKNFWDERYSEREFAYGTSPNLFLTDQLGKMKPGKILLPCEGEGRNAVYAAKQGWRVEAFDFSEGGLKKANALAVENKVSINYLISDTTTAEYPVDYFDVVALIFAHLPSYARKRLHQKCITWLKPGGVLILEAFNTSQLQNKSGGPKEQAMLYTEAMLKEDFKDLTVKLLTSVKISLSEGEFHQGSADLVRFVGSKGK